MELGAGAFADVDKCVTSEVQWVAPVHGSHGFSLYSDRPSWTILRYTDRVVAEHYEYDRALWFYFCNEEKGDKVKQVLMEHDRYVHKVVPPERLLEFHRQNGWKPLCRFLNLRESQTLYAMRNDSGGRQAAMEEFWRRCVRRSIMKITPSVIAD
ncbi:NAD dependent epimerase/dehydratase [Aspergillus luchuensis]|uniref:NAD dependent epimerase/dehydratase n=1 Tax=Aspergillus kawachii TaxID=1069201 RepID=A0A146FLF7_ASPKA|nr:NAD dependent epimerase/dehydratase [Aspergillus luchuensis]